MSEVLIFDGNELEPNDYTLKGDHCWITVRNVSVHIKATDEGVCVALYPLNREEETGLRAMSVPYAEAAEER
jgi:hypothetical protein